MNTQNYKDTLIKNLIVFYRLDSQEAADAVEKSTVAYMLNHSEESAKWQMHQSLNATLKEISRICWNTSIMNSYFSTQFIQKITYENL